MRVLSQHEPARSSQRFIEVVGPVRCANHQHFPAPSSSRAAAAIATTAAATATTSSAQSSSAGAIPTIKLIMTTAAASIVIVLFAVLVRRAVHESEQLRNAAHGSRVGALLVSLRAQRVNL